jgi:pimeloyl-ACP methyl ester carboxylesterase
MEANPASVRPAVPNCAPDPTPERTKPEKYLARVNKLSTLLLVALPLLAAGCGKQTAPQRVDTRERGAPVIVGGGRLVDVGGHRLYLRCAGSGSPTVLLEAGFGGSSSDWRDTQRDLARTTRTCAYDRAGLGSSVGRPGVHDASDEIRDLQQLLFSARIPPPYVLAGHSYGGLLTRLYAHAHPRDVAGLVLVDADGRNATQRQLAIWPESVEPDARKEAAEPVVNDVDVRSSETLDARVRSLGDLPLIVIEAGRHEQAFGPDKTPLWHAEARLWSRMQAELARLSSDHVHVLARRSDHFVQRIDGQPRVVADALRAVVRAAREKTRLPPCAALFHGAAVRCLSGEG